MDVLQLNKVLVGAVRTDGKGRGKLTQFQCEFPEPEHLGDELDRATSEMCILEFHDECTGEFMTRVLGYPKQVKQAKPQDGPRLILVVHSSFSHCKPAQLRRLGHREVTMRVQVLEDHMRAKAVAQAEGRVLPVEVQ